jgi:DNA-binding protein H-NS
MADRSRRHEQSESENTDKIAEVVQVIETLDYPELLRLRDIIDKEYKQKAEAARERVIAETREKFEQLGLTFDDVFSSPQKRKRAVRAPVVAKYRSPDGKEWSGRGATPKWIREYEETGGKRDDYLISHEG